MDLKVMPKSYKGHKLILCIIDEVTNYLITATIFQSRSEEIGEALIENIISKYCVPDYIIMDLDSAFMFVLMNYLFKKFGIKIKIRAPYNHQSLDAEHRTKSPSNILTKHLTDQGQMWPKHLPLATLVYNTFNFPNVGNYFPHELVFGRKWKLLLDLETDLNIKVSGTSKDYYTLLNKRLQYLHNLLQDCKLKRLHNTTFWYERTFVGKINQWFELYLHQDGVGHYAINSIFSLTTIREKYVRMYERFLEQLKMYAIAIRIISKGYLPILLLPPSKLYGILSKVKKALQIKNKDYDLVLSCLCLYYHMKLVTFGIDEKRNIIVQFPIFVQPYTQKQLILCQIETVPVPILDQNEEAQLYTQLKVDKPYIALNSETYISLHSQQLSTCKRISYEYYCKEYFVVKVNQDTVVQVLSISIWMQKSLKKTVTLTFILIKLTSSHWILMVDIKLF